MLPQDSNTWASLSDERTKADWRPFVDALGKIQALDTVGTYSRVDVATQKRLSDTRLVGLSAQEVRKILPEAVQEDSNGLLSIKYQDVFVLNLKAAQEMDAQNAALKEELAATREMVAAAKAKLAAGEARLAATRSRQAARDEQLAALAAKVAEIKARRRVKDM